MAYSEKVVDHYENPRNVGSFDKGDDTVGTGMVGAPACGDVMKLQIKVNPRDRPDRGRQVQDLRLRLGDRVELARHRMGQGQVARRGADDQEHAHREELALPPVKIHCSILAEDAIKAAVSDYKAKNPAQPGPRRCRRGGRLTWRSP